MQYTCYHIYMFWPNTHNAVPLKHIQFVQALYSLMANTFRLIMLTTVYLVQPTMFASMQKKKKKKSYMDGQI